jgi:hypothetical protein
MKSITKYKHLEEEDWNSREGAIEGSKDVERGSCPCG